MIYAIHYIMYSLYTICHIMYYIAIYASKAMKTSEIPKSTLPCSNQTIVV